MNEKIKLAFLKSTVYGYALMQNINEDNKNEVWIKQIQDIKKYFSKRSPKGLIKSDINVLVILQTKLKALDLTYFENKPFSPYIVCVLLLNYLIQEKRDLELKNRFLHLDIDIAISELELFFKKEDVNKTHQQFVIKILELIGE